MRSSRLYWACQLGGWSFYAVVGVTVPTLFGTFAWTSVGLALLTSGLGLAFTDRFRAVIRRLGWTRLPLRRLAPRVVAASIVIAIVIVAAISPLQWAWVGEHTPSDYWTGILFLNLFNMSATILGWSLIYFGVQTVRERQKIEAEKWRLEVAIRDAELGALRSQLNPHFLFNSLNGLRGLILEAPARAQEVVTQLAALLRYTLRASRAATVPIAAELDTVRTYLALESVRLDERLVWTVAAEADLADVAIPPMLVQTLVENAIKHGIAREPAGGEIEVRCGREGDEVVIRVVNTGRLEGDPAGGLGLANSRERLQLLFGERASLRLTQEPGGERVTAEVRLPLGGPAAPVPAAAGAGSVA